MSDYTPLPFDQMLQMYRRALYHLMLIVRQRPHNLDEINDCVTLLDFIEHQMRSVAVDEPTARELKMAEERRSRAIRSQVELFARMYAPLPEIPDIPLEDILAARQPDASEGGAE